MEKFKFPEFLISDSPHKDGTTLTDGRTVIPDRLVSKEDLERWSPVSVKEIEAEVEKASIDEHLMTFRWGAPMGILCELLDSGIGSADLQIDLLRYVRNDQQFFKVDLKDYGIDEQELQKALVKLEVKKSVEGTVFKSESLVEIARIIYNCSDTGVKRFIEFLQKGACQTNRSAAEALCLEYTPWAHSRQFYHEVHRIMVRDYGFKGPRRRRAIYDPKYSRPTNDKDFAATFECGDYKFVLHPKVTKRQVNLFEYEWEADWFAPELKCIEIYYAFGFKKKQFTGCTAKVFAEIVDFIEQQLG